MDEISIFSSLRKIFLQPDKEMWKRAASQEIDGKDPFIELSWRNSDGINFFPYYDRNDVSQLEYLKKFRLASKPDALSDPRTWLCIPSVSVTNDVKANEISRDHLLQGADGLIFHLNSSANLDKLLNKIEWPFCSLFFRPSDIDFAKKNLLPFISKSNYPKDSLTGALFWERIPKKSEVELYLNSQTNFKLLGLIIDRAPAANEIASALTKGVATIENLRANDLHADKIFPSIAFSISIDESFFETIAKLKALRLLWYQVSQVYGLKNYSLQNLLIHAQSQPWISKNFEPHSNMIKSTTAAMASVLGGCDALTILPEDENNTTMNRIARNVSAILREESHLNKVADPLAGSYSIDTMVDEISKKAWTLFQSNMKP